MRVVGSLTVMPDRYEKLLNTLKSIKDQTYQLDVLYLSLPYRSHRLKIPYPEITDEIKKYCTVVRCDDYGPITKILGALISESDPETVIITFDDDTYYPSNIIMDLINCHKQYPDSAVGTSGMLLDKLCPNCAILPNGSSFMYRIPQFRVPEEGRKVDSIYGYPGALYVRKFFPDVENLDDLLKYTRISDAMFINDDIVISGYLSLKNIERRVFTNLSIVNQIMDSDGKVIPKGEHDISYDVRKFFHRLNLAIVDAKKAGMYQITEYMDFTETVSGISIVLVICAILLIIAIVIFFLDRSTQESLRFLYNLILDI